MPLKHVLSWNQLDTISRMFLNHIAAYDSKVKIYTESPVRADFM